MIIALLIAAAPGAGMVAVAHRSPPVVVSPPVPSSDVATPAPVHLRITAGNRELYNDTLRVARNAGASYSESRSEASESVCAGGRYSGSSERHSLNIQLYLRDDMQSGQAVNVSVDWKRPGNNIVCGGEGSRTVQLTQTVPLTPGQSTTLHGDAGLTVTITR